MTKPVALIVGGGSGIGADSARKLSDIGYDVAVLSSSGKGEALGTELGGLGFTGSNLEPDDLQAFVDATMDRFGRIDTLVMNAGLVAGDTDPDAERAFDLHVAANDRLLRAALPHLSRGASIVAISSVNAVLPARGAALYSASKAALNTWVRAMAKELGPRGIRVNAVAPGATELPEAPRDPKLVDQFAAMTALGRVATPDDIAAPVRFLCSDAARHITGEILTVSGGYRL